jgi:hypothetical protein
MAINVGDLGQYPIRARRDSVLARALIDIGATGAPTVSGDQGIAITRTGVGTYTGTFPACPTDTLSLPTLDIRVQKSAAVTVAGVVITALSMTLGTVSFQVYLNTAGTPVEAANGDRLVFELISGVSAAF